MNGSLATGVRSAGLAALCLAAGSGRFSTVEAAQKGSRDAAAVERVIRASAQALTDFPRTLDTDAVLVHFAASFVGIENGEESSLQDQRELLAELRDQMAAGAQVILSLHASNVRVRVSGSMAVATYDYRFRIGVVGEFADDEDGKCTAILEKADGRWLFRHEHCSSPCPPCEDEDDAEDDPLRRTPSRT